MKNEDGALIYMRYTDLVDTRKLPDAGGPFLPGEPLRLHRGQVRKTAAERYSAHSGSADGIDIGRILTGLDDHLCASERFELRASLPLRV
jgi:hypothetical protein